MKMTIKVDVKVDLAECIRAIGWVLLVVVTL